MAKPRKTLGKADSPYIVSLMRLIESQSKSTVVNWCVDYAEAHYLPLYEQAVPKDTRPRAALAAARAWLAGDIKLPAAKPRILDAHAAAREAEGNPVAQASARAVGQAASTIHARTHSLGLAFYGSAAAAYDQLGLEGDPDTYDRFAAEECGRMEAALRAVATSDEQTGAE